MYQSCPRCEGHGTLVDEECYTCFGTGIDNDWIPKDEDEDAPLCETCDGYGFGAECPACEGEGELQEATREPQRVGSLEHISTIMRDLFERLDDGTLEDESAPPQ